jgi:hypothetical protein
MTDERDGPGAQEPKDHEDVKRSLLELQAQLRGERAGLQLVWPPAIEEPPVEIPDVDDASSRVEASVLSLEGKLANVNRKIDLVDDRRAEAEYRLDGLERLVADLLMDLRSERAQLLDALDRHFANLRGIIDRRLPPRA